VAVQCPKCRAENTSDSQFCKKCATPLPWSREAGFSQTETLLPPREDLTTGTIFAGRYQVIEELGHGGMGKVYKVFDRETDSKVALKLIKPGVAADKNTIERFRNELKLARDISHKHICRMYDLGRDGDDYFITMEYVPGEDLKSFIRRARRLDIGTAIAVAKQVCEGLAEAHRAGVVHRDLKPSNIMIDRDGDAKIMDFGIARSLRKKGITGPGVVIGTPEYMSPEQVEGKEADQRADLYSLSIILYEMVTGAVPFDGETAFAIGLKHKSEPPENPKTLNPQIPDDLSRLILKGLEKDKEKRYQTAAELLSDLIKIENGLPTTEKTIPIKKPLTSREITVRFGYKKLAVPAVAAAVVAVGIFLFFLFRNRQPLPEPVPLSHKQLTFTGDSILPAISPDGRSIAYVNRKTDTQGSLWSLLVQDMQSGRSIEIFSAEYIANLGWTPDDSEIAVLATEDSKTRYMLVSRLGGPARQIAWRPDSWSPDGSDYAFCNQPQDGWMEIFTINKATGSQTSFKISAPFDFSCCLKWSPLGDRFLFLAIKKDGVQSIWTVKTDGSQQTMILEDSGVLDDLAWAPKGDAIFYFRGQIVGNPTELWKLPISRDTGKPKGTASLVLSGIPMGGSFTLSTDGKKFLYTRLALFSNLHLVRIEGSERNRMVKTQQLTTGTSLHSGPDISPDGKFIVFSKGSGGIMNIYVMPIEGGNPTQLTFFNSNNINPAWSPDGTQIAFGSNEGGKYRVWRVGSQGGRLYQYAKTELSHEMEIAWAPESQITYQKAGNRNFMILDPITEEETALVKDESVGWIFSPAYSPDGKKVAVNWNRQPTPGLWVISLDDSSEKFMGGSRSRDPIGWSPDGRWVYARETTSAKTDYLMIDVESGQTKPLPILPFTIDGKTYFKVVDDKPGIFVDGKSQSDVWVIENFDQIIK